MIKLLLPLVLFFSGGAYAAEAPLPLETVSLEAVGAITVPPVNPAVPFRMPAKADEQYFNAYILKSID